MEALRHCPFWMSRFVRSSYRDTSCQLSYEAQTIIDPSLATKKNWYVVMLSNTEGEWANSPAP